MALDHYSQCPCGSGKKIKFCCCNDIISDLEKVMRSVEGEQRVGALEQINRLLATKGKRAALLSLKIQLHLSQQDLAQAEAASDDFLQLAPNHPTALAYGSILCSLKGNVTGAVDMLQQAMAADVEMLPFEVARAVSMLARVFVQIGDVIAARAHIYLEQTLSGGEKNRESDSLLFDLSRSAEVPLLLRQDFRLDESPDGVAWETEFDTAMDFADNLCWQQSCERFVAMAGKLPPHPAILKNIAILRSWLGDSTVATAAWHAYAELENVALDDAVEAEALAQLLDPETHRDRLDHIQTRFEINNTDRVMETLLSDRHFTKMPVDPAELVEEGEVPPKALFYLLDRPVPANSEGLTCEGVPVVLGEIAVFGRQTDREARLEYSGVKAASYDQGLTILNKLFGEWMNGKKDEEKIGEVAALSNAITFQWRFPDDTSDELKRKLTSEQRREMLMVKWPSLPQAILDGKSVNEAAAIPEYRVRILAAILLLELSANATHLELDFNELRSKLGLPTRDPIECTNEQLRTLPLPRFSLVKPEALTDEALITAMQRARFYGERVAGRRFANEALKRESLKADQSALAAYDLLIASSQSREEMLGYFDKAKEAAIALKVSPAYLMLSELPLRIVRGDAKEVQGLIDTLQRRHVREPGVAEGLYNILLRFGFITPDGRPRVPSQGMPGAPATPATAAASGLWTPDAGPAAAAPAAAGEAKSKLWLPGMD